MKTVVLANHKGGVGKSAVATLLAHHWRREGRRVLAIDFDHQGNLSNALRLSGRVNEAGRASDLLQVQERPTMPKEPFVLVPSDDGLLWLERQASQHTPFARAFREFLGVVDDAFDVCIVDTNPNPDIRLICALASANHVLCPIQLNQEAIDGVRALLHHPRLGLTRIKAVLNPKLNFVGLLPTLVEATPFQKENFEVLIRRHLNLMIRCGDGPGDLARIPKRSAIAEAQAEGQVLWEMKKTAAREATVVVEPALKRITEIVLEVSHAV